MKNSQTNTNLRPIIFSTAMVQALLSGDKTQTRRIVKDTSIIDEFELFGCKSIQTKDAVRLGAAKIGPKNVGHICQVSDGPNIEDIIDVFCPYGKVGDVLWVRESWRTTQDLDVYSGKQIAEMAVAAGYKEPWAPLHCEADGFKRDWVEVQTPNLNSKPLIPGRLRPRIHMPKWASRIKLQITNVRIERLQDISESDALAEGVRYADLPVNDQDSQSAKTWFRGLWATIYGDESWSKNPYLWVIEFKRI